MYECPNCAGNMKFDIVRQQMYCEYCGTQADPYSIYKDEGTGETGAVSGEYTCPIGYILLRRKSLSHFRERKPAEGEII